MEEQLARLREFGIELEAIPLSKDQSSLMINLTGDAERPMVVANVNGERMPFYFSSGAGGKTEVPPNRWYPAAGLGSEKGWINKGKQTADDLFYSNKHLERVGMALDEVFGNASNQEFIDALPVAYNEGKSVTKDFINAGQKFTDLTNDKKPVDPEAYKSAMQRLRTFASDKPLPTPPAPPPPAETSYTPQFVKQAQTATTESAVTTPAAETVKAMAQRPQAVATKVPASILNYRINLPPAVAPALGAVGSVVGMGLQGYGATRENSYDREHGLSDPYGLRPAWDFMGKLSGMYEDSNTSKATSIPQAWGEMKSQVADPEYQLRSPTTAVVYNALQGNLEPAKGFAQGVQDFYAPMWQKLNSPSEGNTSMMEGFRRRDISMPTVVTQTPPSNQSEGYIPAYQGFAQGLKDAYLPMWQGLTSSSSGNNLSMMEVRR